MPLLGIYINLSKKIDLMLGRKLEREPHRLIDAYTRWGHAGIIDRDNESLSHRVRCDSLCNFLSSSMHLLLLSLVYLICCHVVSGLGCCYAYYELCRRLQAKTCCYITEGKLVNSNLSNNIRRKWMCLQNILRSKTSNIVPPLHKYYPHPIPYTPPPIHLESHSSKFTSLFAMSSLNSTSEDIWPSSSSCKHLKVLLMYLWRKFGSNRLQPFKRVKM